MQAGKIILLNGTSSSGKSSIIKALQEILDEPYLEAGLDKFLFMLPRRYLERPLWDDVLGLAVQAGTTGHTLISGMHQAVASLSRAGNNILIDHVLVEATWRQECAHLFCNLPAYLIGVHCPMEILEERECSRNNRTLGQAKAQFDIVHRGLIYDLEVNTAINLADECARQITHYLQSQTAPTALKGMAASLKKTT